MGCGSALSIKDMFGLSDFDKGASELTGYTQKGMQEARDATDLAVQGLSPYSQAGTEALDLYKNIVLGGDMSSFYTSPAYQFRLNEGINALEQGASAQGNLYSGAQSKALQQYGQNLASEEYNNYLNSVGNLMNQGYGASGMQGGYYTGLGNTLASGYSNLGSSLAQQYAMRGQQKAEILGAALGAGGSYASGGTSGGTGGGTGSSGANASDKNVKENIVYINEKTKDGIEIVEFNYKKGYGDTSKRYRGVIAQDVEKIKPEAVIEEDGIKKVKYDLLDIKMEEV